MIQEGKTAPAEAVEVTMPATEHEYVERMTCCCIDQPKYFNFGQRKIRRKIVYIVTIILSLGIVGLIVGLIMKAAIVGDSYTQGDSFSKVQVTSCAYVDVVFNA